MGGWVSVLDQMWPRAEQTWDQVGPVTQFLLVIEELGGMGIWGQEAGPQGRRQRPGLCWTLGGCGASPVLVAAFCHLAFWK